MKIRALPLLLSVLTLMAAPARAVLLWTVGLDDNAWPFTAAAPGNGGGANATFVQENGNNPLPGNPANAELDGQSDDDYYFAGSYNTIIATNGSYTPVGTVAANEESVERALTAGNNQMRYHFNVPATYGPNDRIAVTFDVLNFHTGMADPRRGVEIYINGNIVMPEQIIRPAQINQDYTSPQKKLSEVGIVTGPGADNIVTLKGISYSASGGGDWMGVDFVKVDIDNSVQIINTFTANPTSSQPGAPVTLAWTLFEPTATLSISPGVGTVTGSSVTVNPAVTTTYTLSATFGGNTQTRTATVTVAPFITTFTAADPLIIPGNSTNLAWTIPAGIAGSAVMSIDQGVGAVTAPGGSGSIAVSPVASTVYTLSVTHSGVTQTKTVPVNVGEWTVGIDDAIWNFTAQAPGNGGGINTTFVQENGGVNALPGNKASAETDTGGDNDYYFAGNYTTLVPGNGTYAPAGLVAAHEESVERAYGGADTQLRYHFNVPAGYSPNARVSVAFDALNLDTSATNADPRWGVEIYINGNLVRPEEIIRPAQFDVDYASPPKKFSEVGIVTGPGNDNIVTLKGISYSGAGGGNWMGIDYMRMSFDNTPLLINTFTAAKTVLRPGDTGTTLSWVLAEPTATVVIDQGIGDVTGNTTAGTGSIPINPAVTTTYTLTATLGAQTQTLSVTVTKSDWDAIFEGGSDNSSHAEFSHEDAADDDYYFAGNYTSVGGPNQAANELLNDDADTNTVPGRTGSASVGFERSLSELDPVQHIWFVPSPAMLAPEARIRLAADVLSSSGVNTLEFSVNDTLIHTRTGLAGPTLVQFEVTGLSSALVSGPNKLTIRRNGSTLGGSVTFDYVMLEHMTGTLPVITGITDDAILGTHTVNWTAIAGRTYRVQKSADAGATWIELSRGHPTGGATSTSLFFEDRVTPWTDPVPAYRVLLE